MIPIVIDDPSPELCRAIQADPNFESAQFNSVERGAHLYEKGQTCILDGLTTYPQFNGQPVKIVEYRDKEGQRGVSYYIEGEINAYLNWVYEDRLKPQEAQD